VVVKKMMMMIRRNMHYFEISTGNFGILSLTVVFTNIRTIDPLFALK
jgi:hypothetical protein